MKVGSRFNTFVILLGRGGVRSIVVVVVKKKMRKKKKIIIILQWLI